MLISLAMAFASRRGWRAPALKHPPAGPRHACERASPAASASASARAPTAHSMRGCGRRNRALGLLGGVAALIAASRSSRLLGLWCEDAAVRQQVRVPDRRRHARGHAGRADGGGAARAPARSACASPRSPTTRRMPARRRRSTSTAWCASTTCAAASDVADLQVNLLSKARRSAAEPRHRQAHAPGPQPHRRPLRRPRQGRRGAARPAGARDAGRRGLRAGHRGRERRSRARCATCSSAPPGVVDVDWYVEDAHPKERSWSTRRRRRSTASRADAIARHAGIVMAGGPLASCTSRANRKTCRHDAVDCARALRTSGRLLALRVRGARRPLWCRSASSSGSSASRGPQHLSQEPAAGGLRDRRRRRRRREPGATRFSERWPRRTGATRRRGGLRSAATTRPSPPATSRPRSSGTASGTSPTRCSATSALAFAVVLVLIYVLVVGGSGRSGRRSSSWRRSRSRWSA